jgi:hypothetical protein
VSKKPDSYEGELAAIMNALAESVAEASNEEVLEDVRVRGEDPTEAARQTKDVLLNTLKLHGQRRLHEAQKQYDVRIADMRAKKYQLPDSASERRQLFDFVLSQQSAVRSLITTQHREFISLSDDDVESFLRQLQELGFLDELSKSKGNTK